MPSPKAIQEFKELFFQRYKVQLSDMEAAEQAGQLLRLYKAVYGDGKTEPNERTHETKQQN